MKTNDAGPCRRRFLRSSRISALLFLFRFIADSFVLGEAEATEKDPPKVVFKTIGTETKPIHFECRRMVVGPWVRQPDEYEGYNGFVGWPGLARLKSGRWLLTFSSGYWHASPPLTEDILKDEKSREYFEAMKKIGMPDVTSPRGGRAHVMHSDDQGKTWSNPTLLVDTELDDRHPTILELNDGTLLCTFFAYAAPSTAQAKYMLSTDQGKSWSAPKTLPGEAAAFGNGSAIQLADGTVVVAADQKSDKEGIAILRSTDRGRNFKLASVVETDHPQYEPTIAQLPDGRLILITRREGTIYWSKDGGKSWSPPASTGVNLYDPHLVVMPNGVLACFHGSYEGGGLRVILSPDNGKTWHGPKKHIGYSVDPSVYAYSHPMLLPDGTIYLVYLHTGGHRPAHARTEALWTIRIRINENADGIQLLPSPGGARFITGLESAPRSQR